MIIGPSTVTQSNPLLNLAIPDPGNLVQLKEFHMFTETPLDIRPVPVESQITNSLLFKLM